MPTSNQKYTDNVGGGYPGREKPTSVKITHDASKMRNSNTNSDPLARAFGSPPSKLPMGEHTWGHSKTPRPKGALYHPMGEFGTPNGTLHSKATSIRSFNSKPGKNAVGQPSEMMGDNALGGYKPARGSFRGNP